MSTRLCTPPTDDSSQGCSTDDSLRSSICSTWATISGLVRSMTARRMATSRCRSSARPLITIAAWSGVM